MALVKTHRILKGLSLIEKLQTFDQLYSDFENNKSWDKQYRLIIQLGKKLPTLAETEKTEVHQVKGCESLAWCIVEKKGHNFHFTMDSVTRVVRGLMMILLIIYQDKNQQQINAIDINAVFDQLGLLSHLSPSRTNGLLAIVEKINQIGNS
jgi:cysteine desulfuration protein SufE